MPPQLGQKVLRKKGISTTRNRLFDRVYLNSRVTSVLCKKATDVLVMTLRNADVIVLLRGPFHRFTSALTCPGKFCSNTAKPSFTALNPSKLHDKLFLISAFISPFWGPMF